MKGTVDTFLIIKRNIKRNFRLPQLLIFSTIQPVIFLLMFNFVFGGAVTAGTNEEYINFLLPGIFAQIALFGAIQTGVALAEDLDKGAIDRLRSLPIARYAVLAGRTLADSARNVFVIAILAGIGFVLGFEHTEGTVNFLLACGLVILFAFAASWVSAVIGLFVRDTETVQVSGFLWVFPLVFASSVFVPTDTMSDPLKSFAENQPVTQVVNALRYLTRGTGEAMDIWVALFWIGGIILVFAPIAVWRYRKIQ